MEKFIKVLILLLSAGISSQASNRDQVDSTAIGDSLMQVFQFEKAREVYYSIHRFHPGNQDVLYKLGYCHTQLGNYRDAIIYLKESFNLDSTQLNVALQLATVHTRVGLMEEAGGYYMRLIRLDPENGYYRKLAATSLAALGKVDEAVIQLLHAIEFNDMDMESYHQLAKLYFNSGNFELAKKTAHDGLSKNNRNVDLLFISARVSFYFKNYTEVINLGINATSINKDTSRWNLYMGYSNYFLKQYKESILWLNTAVQDKSIGEQGYTYLANALIKEGDDQGALVALDKAIIIARDNNLESNLQNKAILLNNRHKDAEAISLLEQAYHLERNAPVLFKIGEMYYHQKKYNKASSYLNRYQKSGDKVYLKECADLLNKLKIKK